MDALFRLDSAEEPLPPLAFAHVVAGSRRAQCWGAADQGCRRVDPAVSGEADHEVEYDEVLFRYGRGEEVYAKIQAGRY